MFLQQRGDVLLRNANRYSSTYIGDTTLVVSNVRQRSTVRATHRRLAGMRCRHYKA